MNIVSLFKNEHKINIPFFVTSYIIIVFFLSLITFITVIIINYINRHSLVFDMGFAIKIIKMLSIAGLFSFIWSAFCIYNDKKKCTKLASDLMKQYNKFNVNSYSEKKTENIKHIIKTMDRSRHLYGLMSGFIVSKIDTRVKGINIKEISYYLSCEVEYKTGEKDRFKLKFSAINGDDPVLKSISF